MRRFATAFLLLGLVGCSLFAPRTAALDSVHAAYREEFEASLMPPRPSDPPSDASTTVNAFPRTLRAIREARLVEPADSPASAHLDVLEGMVYLQAFQTGMARAVLPRVTEAEKRLGRPNGGATRDQLFARAFPALVDGHERIRLRRASAAASATDFEQAGDRLAAALAATPRDALADPDVDQGALYLATVGAVYYTWSASLVSARDRQAAFYAKGRDLVGGLLTSSEKAAAVAWTDEKSAQVPGRLRSLEWYRWLDQMAKTP